MRKYLILFFYILLSSAAYSDCDNVICKKDSIEKYKKELNKAFDELVRIDVNNITVDSFKNSQVLWNKFIKEDCKFMNSPMSMTQGEGYIIVYYECLEKYYIDRINQVNQMISDIK